VGKTQWNGLQAYSDTKFHDTLLGFAMARHWRDVYSNVVDPGWVATRMGGPNAPGDLDAGFRTQVWLATSDDPEAQVTGEYFFHKEFLAPHRATRDVERQERLLEACQQISGVKLPAS